MLKLISLVPCTGAEKTRANEDPRKGTGSAKASCDALVICWGSATVVAVLRWGRATAVADALQMTSRRHKAQGAASPQYRAPLTQAHLLVVWGKASQIQQDSDSPAACVQAQTLSGLIGRAQQSQTDQAQS